MEAAAVTPGLDRELSELRAVPGLNPRALAVAEAIAARLPPACRAAGRASPSETGVCLTWSRPPRDALFCDTDTPEDDSDPDHAPIVIMLHLPHVGGSFSWAEQVEYAPSAEAAAGRIVAEWERINAGTF